MLDTFYTQLRANWPAVRENWVACLSKNIPQETFREMKESALSALMPEPFQQGSQAAHACANGCALMGRAGSSVRPGAQRDATLQQQSMNGVVSKRSCSSPEVVDESPAVEMADASCMEVDAGSVPQEGNAGSVASADVAPMEGHDDGKQQAQAQHVQAAALRSSPSAHPSSHSYAYRAYTSVSMVIQAIVNRCFNEAAFVSMQELISSIDATYQSLGEAVIVPRLAPAVAGARGANPHLRPRMAVPPACSNIHTSGEPRAAGDGEAAAGADAAAAQPNRPVYPRFCSNQRYGPQVSRLLLEQKDEQSVLRYLRHFAQEVCLAVLYFTVCMRMEILKGNTYPLPVWACVCCMEREISVLFRPCQHRCLCVQCYENFRMMCNGSCPLCRSPILEAIRLRRSGCV